MNSARHHQGFTLIELSIVLVIIALVVSGIVFGKTMIDNARTQRMMSELQEYSTALNTFRLKYNCIAGDCVNAASLALGTSGNGDGKIGQVSTLPCNASVASEAVVANGECQTAWVHLSAANLIQTQGLSTLGSTATIARSGMGSYFPAFANTQTYLSFIPINGRLFIHTGLTTVNAGGAYFEDAAITGAQMMTMASKHGIPIIDIGTTCPSGGGANHIFNCSAAAAHPIIFIGVVWLAGWAYERSPLQVFSGSWDTDCLRLSTSYWVGSVTANPAGLCNVMWEVK